jgi:23S rRNA (pseudouridine1915-N3)-methyltransferase
MRRRGPTRDRLEARAGVRLLIAAVGRLKSGPEADLVSDYVERTRRLGRGMGFSEVAVVEIEAPKALAGAPRRARESELLLAAAPRDARLAALDEHGEIFSSEEFARLLERWRDGGAAAAAFLIGGADGHGEELATRSERRIAFGRATFPHLLVRAMLAEQIYRAMTILAGHPYHRA